MSALPPAGPGGAGGGPKPLAPLGGGLGGRPKFQLGPAPTLGAGAPDLSAAPRGGGGLRPLGAKRPFAPLADPPAPGASPAPAPAPVPGAAAAPAASAGGSSEDEQQKREREKENALRERMAKRKAAEREAAAAADAQAAAPAPAAAAAAPESAAAPAPAPVAAAAAGGSRPGSRRGSRVLAVPPSGAAGSGPHSPGAPAASAADIAGSAPPPSQPFAAAGGGNAAAPQGLPPKRPSLGARRPSQDLALAAAASQQHAAEQQQPAPAPRRPSQPVNDPATAAAPAPLRRGSESQRRAAAAAAAGGGGAPYAGGEVDAAPAPQRAGSRAGAGGAPALKRPLTDEQHAAAGARLNALLRREDVVNKVGDRDVNALLQRGASGSAAGAANFGPGAGGAAGGAGSGRPKQPPVSGGSAAGAGGGSPGGAPGAAGSVGPGGVPHPPVDPQSAAAENVLSDEELHGKELDEHVGQLDDPAANRGVGSVQARKAFVPLREDLDVAAPIEHGGAFMYTRQPIDLALATGGAASAQTQRLQTGGASATLSPQAIAAGMAAGGTQRPGAMTMGGAGGGGGAATSGGLGNTMAGGGARPAMSDTVVYVESKIDGAFQRTVIRPGDGSNGGAGGAGGATDDDGNRAVRMNASEQERVELRLFEIRSPPQQFLAVIGVLAAFMLWGYAFYQISQVAQRKSNLQFLGFYQYTAGFAETTFYVLSTVTCVWSVWQVLLERAQRVDKRSFWDICLTWAIALCYTITLLLSYSGMRVESEIAIRFARDANWLAAVTDVSEVGDGNFASRLESWYQMDSARFAFLTVGFLLVAYKILHMSYAMGGALALLDAPKALVRARLQQQLMHGGAPGSSPAPLSRTSPRVAPSASVQMSSRQPV